MSKISHYRQTSKQTNKQTKKEVKIKQKNKKNKKKPKENIEQREYRTNQKQKKSQILHCEICE